MRNSTLSQTPKVHNCELRKFSFVTLPSFAFLPEECRTSFLSRSKSSSFCENRFGLAECTSTVKSMPWKPWTRPSLGERRRQCTSTGWVGTLSGTSCRNCSSEVLHFEKTRSLYADARDISQSLDYADTLHQQSFGDFQEFMRWTFESEECFPAMRTERCKTTSST